MTDRPILFSGPMVQAILDGRKTQTRRVLHVQPPEWVNFCEQPDMFNALQRWVPSGLWTWAELDESRQRALRRWPIGEDGFNYWVRPRFSVGDRLWVRETWSHTGDGVFSISQARIAPTGRVIYAATPAADAPYAQYWPSIFMPREFSRLTLAITDIRVQRLQDIIEEDAIAEGIVRLRDMGDPSLRSCPEFGIAGVCAGVTGRDAYASLWEGLNAARGFGWDANPWVVAATFRAHRANIDRLPERIAA